MSQKTTKGTEQAAATKPSRELTPGAVLGRAVTKLQAINAAEQHALAQSPAAIKERFELKRQTLFAELEPGIREAVKAACEAMAPKAAE